jgi:hypothetical protein
MIIFVSGGTEAIRTHGPGLLGGLTTPARWGDAAEYINLGAKWAMDNGAFSGLDEEAYLEMLEANAKYAASCSWCVVPDVVYNAPATLEMWHKWWAIVAGYEYPLAFVAQNGLEKMPGEIPWSDFDCLFLGGDTEWKLSHAAWSLTEEAKSRGKWVHMGRVNSQRRLRIAAEFGCDSIDGKGFSQFGKRDLLWAVPMLRFYQLAKVS